VPKYKVEQARKDFIAEMDALDRDPTYLRVQVAFVKDGPDG